VCGCVRFCRGCSLVCPLLLLDMLSRQQWPRVHCPGYRCVVVLFGVGVCCQGECLCVSGRAVFWGGEAGQGMSGGSDWYTSPQGCANCDQPVVVCGLVGARGLVGSCSVRHNVMLLQSLETVCSRSHCPSCRNILPASWCTPQGSMHVVSPPPSFFKAAGPCSWVDKLL
jgi:hypothetical protein